MNLRNQQHKKQIRYGATLALESASCPHEQLARLLAQMHEAGFNTVNFYGLEQIPPSGGGVSGNWPG